ncbi:MAG TPA: O-antigen ligase family protein, partial [Anaeromyxobacteraceae bacterium]|nr:O-antigen ligase family protein [Anaeromyxobacteraceae bacterium]
MRALPPDAAVPEGFAMRRRLGVAAVAALTVHAAFLPLSIAMMQLSLGALLAALAGQRLAGAPAWARSALDVPVLTLAGAAVLSIGLAALAGSPPVGFREATRWWSLLAPLAVLSALEQPGGADGGDAETVRRRVVLVLAAWAAASLLPSALAWAQHSWGLDPLHWMGLRRRAVRIPARGWPDRFAAVGFFTWYQRLAHNLTPPLLLAGAVALYGGATRRVRWLLGLGAAAAAAAVLLTVSRSSWLGLAAGGVALAAASGRRLARWAVPAAVAAAALAALATPGLRSRLSGALGPEVAQTRIPIWRVCAAMVEDRPLLGVGFGSAPGRAGPYYDRLAPPDALRSSCHDSFLTAWVEGGPLLTAALAFYWWGLFRAFWRWRRGAEGPARAGAAGGLAALVAMFLNSLVHDVLYSVETTLALGLALGLAAALARTGR